MTVGQRGLLTSLGAGLCLVVAGVLALTLGASVLAFQGLSSVSPSREITNLRLPDAPPPAAEAGDTEVRKAARKPVVRMDSRRRPAAAARTQLASAGARQRTDGEFTARVQRETGTTRPSPAPAPAPGSEPVSPPAASETPHVVEDVTRQVQEVLDPVVGAAEGVVGVTEDVARDADGVVGGLLPPK